jgi:hypothetical protein
VGAGVPGRELAVRLALEDVRTSLALVQRDTRDGDLPWQVDAYGTARLLASLAHQFQQENRAMMSVAELRRLLRLMRATSHAVESELYLRLSSEDES